MFTLIIFELIPEHTIMTLIPDAEVDAEDLRIFNLAHGKVMNSNELSKEEHHAIMCLNDAFADVKYASDENKGTKWPGRFLPYKDPLSDGSKPLSGPISQVFMCGFAL